MESKKINQLATELTPALSDLTIIGDPTTGISKKITLSQMASLFTGTVEEYANLASFPLVGVADTIYIALDTNVLYRWNTGTNAYVELSPNIINSLVFSDANGFDGTISLVGSTATLTITTALTTGSVAFIGASGALLQDNANFFWDDTNNRLGIGTNVPTTAIDAFGSGIIGRLNGTSTNNSFLGFASAGTNKWSIGNVQSDHRFRIYNEVNTAELVSVLQTGEFGIGISNPTTKLHIDGGASALIANLDANVSVAKSVSFRSDNSNRFNIEVSGTESGSNAGADLFIRRYSDAGALLDTPISITRSTGLITLATALSATSATFSGNLTYNVGNGVDWFLTSPQNGAALRMKGHNTNSGYTDRSGALAWNLNDGTKSDILWWNSASVNSLMPFNGTSIVLSSGITTNAYSYLYGLRISGNDTGNTIYSGASVMGITADSGYNIFIGQANAATTGLNISTTTGNATFSGNIISKGTFIDYQNQSYIRFSNSGGGTRWGYIQHDATNIAFVNDISGGGFTFNKAATFSSVVTGKSFSIVGTNGYSGQIIQQGDIFGTSATNLLIQSSTSNGIGFLTNGSTTFNMLMTSGGNILIGTTTDNGYKLQVNGVTQIRDTLLLTKQVGSFYAQTSASGSTSFINTGIYYNTSIVGFSNNGTYFVSITGNPNGAGSSEYRAVYLGYIVVTTGYDFGIGNVVQRISYTQILTGDAFNIGGLSVSAVFWNGTTESTQQVNGTTSNQIRIKVSGYNGSAIGAAQDVRITKVLD